MDSSLVIAPVLGFVVGFWLILAGLAKMANPGPMADVLAWLLPMHANGRVERAVMRFLPWCEIGVGTAACLAFDSILVRGVVLSLFLVFAVALLVLAARFEQFACGCLGSERVEHRWVAITRGVGGLAIAWLLFVAPVSGYGIASKEALWWLAFAWCALLLFMTTTRARELASSVDHEGGA